MPLPTVCVPVPSVALSFAACCCCRCCSSRFTSSIFESAATPVGALQVRLDNGCPPPLMHRCHSQCLEWLNATAYLAASLLCTVILFPLHCFRCQSCFSTALRQPLPAIQAAVVVIFTAPRLLSWSPLPPLFRSTASLCPSLCSRT